MPTDNTPRFNFEISLSVLNHLGRNLYRSFSTVLGEAISNSWDADAKNVWITLDRRKNRFFVKDDGEGMNRIDFQSKFLKIGYSKRLEHDQSSEGRPYIGRKGIGKLALLSCAKRVTVISKKASQENYVGGTIDNSGLDAAIKDDMEASKYLLDGYNLADYSDLIKAHNHGTIICFDEIQHGIVNTPEFFRKIVAMYFKFSLHDPNFKIYINAREVSHKDLKDLAENTQFLWRINSHKDPYVDYTKDFLDEPPVEISGGPDFHGFIASVRKPRHRTIRTMKEVIGVDLFVNGRVRAKDILKSISRSRITESYLYGQIHYDKLDGDKHIDRFTSGREDIVANDEIYTDFLEKIGSSLLPQILNKWDDMRRSHHDEGDDENASIALERRKSESLYNAIVKSYNLPEKPHIRKLTKELKEAAARNFGAYADCFVSENLIREYIRKNDIDHKSMLNQAQIRQKKEQDDQAKCNIDIDVREKSSDPLTYAGMRELLEITRSIFPNNRKQHINMDLDQYNIIRNALAHTAILTREAKRKLGTVSDNIKAKISELFSASNK